MAILPIGEYRPDVSDFNAEHTANILNVLPRGDGYGPFKSFSPFTGPLLDTDPNPDQPDVCRGYFHARNSDGSVAIFAGTATNLYRLNNTTLTWTEVSRGGIDYSAVPSNDNWQFAQFGNVVIAVHANEPPQAYTIGLSTAFANLGGSPPQAAYVAVVGRFLVLSGLLNDPFTIRWSGLNAITTWTPGVNQSDSQNFPDGGVVRGVAGGEFGLVFQESTIRRMTYAPGSPIIFQIDRITEDMGLLAPQSLIRAADRVLFCSHQGFQLILPGGYPQPIGKEKVDRTFLADLDQNSMRLFMGASDPRSTRVYWAYKSVNGEDGLFDKILGYDIALERWFPISVVGESISSLATPGITLDGLDNTFPDPEEADIDVLELSLDDISTAAFSNLSMIDAQHRAGYFEGSNLEAIVETAEQGAGQRMLIRGVRPVSDAPSIHASVSRRETMQTAAAYTSETAVNALGICPQRASTRYMRAKVRIPEGIDWTFISGVDPDVVPQGGR